MNFCYYSIVFKLSALPLFINTGNIILPVYLGELSRGGEWHRCSPWEMCLLLSLWIHLRLGAQSCLYFEGHTGKIKNQPDAKQLETKAQLEGRKGTGWGGKIKSIWTGLGMTSHRGRARVGSDRDAKLLGKEWEMWLEWAEILWQEGCFPKWESAEMDRRTNSVGCKTCSVLRTNSQWAEIQSFCPRILKTLLLIYHTQH